MKLATIAAAAGLGMTALMGTAGTAEAQSYRDRGYGYDRGYDQRYDHGRYEDRGYHRGGRWDRHGRGYPHRCWTEWRHHHRVRVCR